MVISKLNGKQLRRVFKLNVGFTDNRYQIVIVKGFQFENSFKDKAEWDMEGPVLEEVPDYEETMIWDPARKRRDSDNEEFNAFDAEVGNFEHPDFWEPVGESFGGHRTTSEAEQYSG